MMMWFRPCSTSSRRCRSLNRGIYSTKRDLIQH
jgi:hypothetical protein